MCQRRNALQSRAAAAGIGPSHRGDSWCSTTIAAAARLRREGYDWRPLLPRITARTLALHGTQDLIPARLAGQIVTLIPGASSVLIEGAGHMSFWEQPAEFFGMVQAFLDQPDLGE